MPLAMPRTAWLAQQKCQNERRIRERRSGERRIRGGGILFELLEVALLDLLHHGFAAKQIPFELRRNLARHNEELVSGYFWKRNRTARGNEVRAPLKHQAGVPENKAGEKNARGGECGVRRSKDAREAIQKNAQPQNKKRGKRNKKAASIRRNSRPIRIRRDEVIKRDHRHQKGSAHARHAPPEGHEADESEEKNRRPRKQTVIRGKQNGEKIRRPPKPLADGNVARFEHTSINDAVCDECGEHA